jgi:hypothetical protein
MPFLDWVNKAQAQRVAADVPYHLLQFQSAHGDPSAENLLIQGDNLLALKALLPFYRGRVKCIYIDPPYNTQSAFEHYDDKLEHSQWLSMMWPRLVLLRDLLAEDGSLWISCDDNEAHYIKVICDEAFGRLNFIIDIAWQKRDGPPNDRKIGAIHEHILVWGKGRSGNSKKTLAEEVFNLMPRTEKANSQYDVFKEPDGPDDRGAFRKIDTTANGKGGRFVESLFYGILNPYTGEEVWPRKGTCWRHSKTEMERPNPGDLVLDSFLGSGTTAAVAHKMGRRYIGIEMGEHASTHCLPRLEKVIAGEQGGVSEAVGWQGGGGFVSTRSANRYSTPTAAFIRPCALRPWPPTCGTSRPANQPARLRFATARHASGHGLLPALQRHPRRPPATRRQRADLEGAGASRCAVSARRPARDLWRNHATGRSALARGWHHVQADSLRHQGALTMFALKDYQKKALVALDGFFRKLKQRPTCPRHGKPVRRHMKRTGRPGRRNTMMARWATCPPSACAFRPAAARPFWRRMPWPRSAKRCAIPPRP